MKAKNGEIIPNNWDKVQLFNKFFTEVGEGRAAVHRDFQQEACIRFIVRVALTSDEHTVTHEIIYETLRKAHKN